MGCPTELRAQILAKLRRPSPALYPRRQAASNQHAGTITESQQTSAFTVASPAQAAASARPAASDTFAVARSNTTQPSGHAAPESPNVTESPRQNTNTEQKPNAKPDPEPRRQGPFTVASSDVREEPAPSTPRTASHKDNPARYGGPSPTPITRHKATVGIPPALLTVPPPTVSRSSPTAFTVAPSSGDPALLCATSLLGQDRVSLRERAAAANATEPNADSAAPDSEPQPFEIVFQRLTHVTLARVETTFSNEYPGAFHAVTPAMLRSHFAGDVSLGFAVLEDGSSRGDALFGAMDVDRDFPRRLAVLRRAVAIVGGEALVDACFATTGSLEGRGKIVVTLERPGPAADVRALMAAIKSAALRDPAFGHMTSPDEIELRPLAGTGGLLRILGRNRGKDRPGFKAPLECPLSLDGEIAFLGDVVPLPIATLRAIAAAHRERNNDRFAWVSAWLREAWTYRPEDGNTRGIFRRMVALANAAVERFGSGDAGSAQFRSWCAQVAANSPALDEPSPKNKDERNPLRHEPTIARAWRYAATRDTRWQPLDLIGSGLPEGQIRVYRTLVDFMHSRALAPEMFAINYNYLTTELLGGTCHKKTVWKQVQALVKRGCIVIHDAGMPMRRDERGEYRAGLPTIMGLVGKGQTPADVLAAVQGNPRHYTRIAKRERDRTQLLAPKRIVPAARRAVG
jgi:hypothetical protein